MKKHEIEVGGHYIAKVAGRLTTVRVNAIREDGLRISNGRSTFSATRYDVVNLSTGRKTTFRSAAKFRGPARKAGAGPSKEQYEKALAQLGLKEPADPRDGSGVHDDNPQTEPDAQTPTEAELDYAYGVHGGSKFC